jgi:DNA-binding response OmpR family regulator
MKKILAVDDENLALFSLFAMFKDAETDVMTAATGRDALQAIGRNRLDLCFLDIHFPDLNRLDSMMKLRELSPETLIAGDDRPSLSKLFARSPAVLTPEAAHEEDHTCRR